MQMLSEGAEPAAQAQPILQVRRSNSLPLKHSHVHCFVVCQDCVLTYVLVSLSLHAHMAKAQLT